MSNRPTKGRPLGTSRVDAARSGPRVPLFAVGIAVLVVLLGAGILVARVVSDDGDELTADQADSPAAGAQAFGPVTVEGDVLPPFESTAADPAVGLPAPTLAGETPGGEAVTIAPGDEPLLVAFLAHWCPHCQVEAPLLAELADDDGLIEGARVVAVATDSNSQAPEYPPGDWLAREGWPGPVLLDTEPQGQEGYRERVAAEAYGIGGYPFLVAVDAEGTVVARTAGELGADGIRQVAALAAGEG